MPRRPYVPVLGTGLLLVFSVACARKPVTTKIPPPVTAAPAPAARAIPQRVGPVQLYPNPSVTPGKADTTDIADLLKKYPCPPSLAKKKSSCTYSEAHRDVPDSVHKAVYDAYNVPPEKRHGASGEVDHFDPMCNGGSNDIANLWYQPAENMWNGKNFGFHQKDLLESTVCARVKKKSMTPLEAYACLVDDWVACYLKMGLDKKAAPKVGVD